MLKQSRYLLFILSAVLLGLGSCKKNETFNDIDVNTDRTIVEFSEAPAGGSRAVDYSNDVVTVDLTEIRLFIRSWLKNGSATAKIISSPAAVAAYNSENGTNYTAFPNASFSFESDEFTFNQNDRAKPVKIRLRTSDLLGTDYAIGLSIQNVTNGEPSQKAGTVVVAIAVKNKYDGIYDVAGSMVDANGVYTGLYPRSGVGLRTASLSSVDYLDPDYAVPAPFFDNAYIIRNISTGGLAWLYSPRFVFNTTTDKVTSILDTDGNVPAGVIAPGDPNQFTINGPDDKTFTIKYTVAGRFTITENWTYTGPR